jgi:hypothetical protein
VQDAFQPGVGKEVSQEKASSFERAGDAGSAAEGGEYRPGAEAARNQPQVPGSGNRQPCPQSRLRSLTCQGVNNTTTDLFIF